MREQFFQPTPIACRLEICRQPPDCSVPGKIRRDIFMLVKEALNNVLKHSGAREVWLKIAVRGIGHANCRPETTARDLS